MDSDNRELAELRGLIAQLTERVYRIEQRLGIEKAPEVDAASAIPAQASPGMEMPIRVVTPPPPLPVAALPSKVSKPSDSPDLESRIGSQWLNRIGIIAVLIGVSFFLKYAFENNWIGPTGRISIGLIAGIAVVLWSERFRGAGHAVFSWSLKAVGVGTLYLSLWAAFQIYHLLPSGLAFAGMVVVTAATATMAVTQDAEVLAAFALVGGFATPLLLSAGQNRELVLFSYAALLDIATLVLTACRPWRRLLIGAFIGTLILYVGWYAEFYSRPQLVTTMAFATLFFVTFALAPLFAKGRTPRTADSISPTLILLPLFNAALYFLAVYVLFEDVSRTATAWIAVALAAVYLALSRQVQVRLANEASSRLLTMLHIALAVGFLTTAIPLKLETYWITIAWLVESAVLLWVGYRAKSDFEKGLSLVALVLGIGRLVVFDHFQTAHLVFNARFFIYTVAIAVVAFASYLAREGGAGAEREGIAIAVIVINVLALLALNLEARDYFVREITALNQARGTAGYSYVLFRNIDIARNFAYSAIWMVYGAVLMWIGFWKRSSFLRWQALVLLAVTIVKVFVFDTSQLERGYRIISFIALGALLLAVSFVYQRDWLKLSGSHRGRPDNARGNSAPL
jgi:uncharacterized membrane protein